MLYILIEGRVTFHKLIKPRHTSAIDLRQSRVSGAGNRLSMRKQSSSLPTNAVGSLTATRGEEIKVGECTPESARPLFGEIALWDRKPRQASARSAEPTKVLVVHKEHFPLFMALLPDMEAVFAVGNALYARQTANNRRQMPMPR